MQFVFAAIATSFVGGCDSGAVDGAPADAPAVQHTDIVSDTDASPVTDTDDAATDTDSPHTDMADDTDVSVVLLPPNLSPGYVDITPTEVRNAPAWGVGAPGEVLDYPALIVDLDGDCVPQLGSADCNGFVCKRPAACMLEVVFTTQRSLYNPYSQSFEVTETGLVYSYDHRTSRLIQESEVSSLSNMGIIEGGVGRPMAYIAGLYLYNDEARTSIVYGQLNERVPPATTWRRATRFDPGPCGQSGYGLLGYGDYDRDGWVDVLMPSNDHVQENPGAVPPTVTVLCDQGPVLLQTQTPGHKWEWHDAFPRSGNNNRDFHDTYAFVNIPGGAGGDFQVLAMGRPRPNGIIGGAAGGMASGMWLESGLDSEGYPVATQGDFVDSAFSARHPMGGDQVYYYNTAPSQHQSPWRSLVFSTTVTSFITAGEMHNGLWFDSGQSTGISFPVSPATSGTGNSGPWGAIQVDPNKDGVSDLLVNFINDGPVGGTVTPYLAAWWSPPQNVSGWVPFREWPQGQIGDINVVRGGRGGRSLASYDIDHDGDLDIVDVGADSPPRLLRNDIPGNSISVSLVGHTSNAMGIGSTIDVEWPNGFKVRRFVGASWNPNIAQVPNYEFGLGPYTEAHVTVTWHSGVVFDYGTVHFDATPGANNAYVFYEPPMVSFSDEDRLMERGQAQLVSICPRLPSQEVDHQATVAVSIQNYRGAQATINSPVRLASGCWESVLRAGLYPGSSRLTVTITAGGVAQTLNIRPRIWEIDNPGYVE